MVTQEAEWTKLADLSEVPLGEAKAVQIGEGRSIALFNIDGKLYATDNQCPHMGYPLTRGRVRHGILTCDWHERSFDLEGGGCFNVECDDLQTFPAEVRGGEIWVELGDWTYRRKAEHLSLLWEGLLSGDRWTMSKAIALLLKGGVAEVEIVELVLQHLGRHIASSHGSEAGWDIARLMNGLAVGRRYNDSDRLIALTTAASASSGGAAERLEVVPLPEPVGWENIEPWVRTFSRDGHSGRIERCLFTAYTLGDAEKILPLLFECTVEPHFLGFSDNLISLGYLSEAVDEFGWEKASELVFNLGSKLVGRGRGEPQRFRRDAIGIMREKLSELETGEKTTTDYDEDAFVNAVSSVDVQRAFDAVTSALRGGVSVDKLISTLVILSADRMARTPVNVDAGWECLTTELNLAASLRTVQHIAGDAAAAKGIFHSAWLTFDNRWLNIPSRTLTPLPVEVEFNAGSEEEGLQQITNAIETLNVQAVGGQVLGYLNAGYSSERLLHALGKAILWDDTGMEILPTLRTVLDEWKNCAGHPARNQLIVALARYATDIRTNKDSQSATTTAMRFAEGRTTVEIFDD